METALIIFHYFVCSFLIILILIQAGKGADIGAAFGGASQTVFGGRGPATFLSKLTTVAAILFLMTSITLAQMTKKATIKSVFDNIKTSQEVAAPESADLPAVPEQQPVPAAPAGETKK